MIKVNNGSEVIIMAYSIKLGELLRDATCGMTRKEVLERIQPLGVSPSVWDRIIGNNHVPNMNNLTAIAEGLQLPLKEVISAASGEDTGIDGRKVVETGLQLLELSPTSRMIIMRMIRERESIDRAHAEADSAA